MILLAASFGAASFSPPICEPLCVRLLIVSINQDAHATIVAAAIKSLGHSVVLWDAPEESSAIDASIFCDENDLAWNIRGRKYPYDYFDVIWLRRRRQTTIPQSIHDDDKSFVQGEANAFFDTIWSMASPKTRWIHHPQIATAAESKLKQLMVAQQVGLRFPPSLMSNDREAILQFIDESVGLSEQVIYKTFSPMGWKEGNLVKLKHTTPVSASQIEANALIEAVPGIYQRRIAKSYEVRSTFFGDREVSVSIDSQRHPYGKEDWRSAINLEGYLSGMTLPADIREKCRSLMSLMSLEMACFDFIVDQQGDYYFLELNQQGQFLWVEQQCPGIPMLDTFVSFIADEAKDGAHARLSVSQVMATPAYEEIAERFDKERFVHVE